MISNMMPGDNSANYSDRPAKVELSSPFRNSASSSDANAASIAPVGDGAVPVAPVDSVACHPSGAGMISMRPCGMSGISGMLMMLIATWAESSWSGAPLAGESKAGQSWAGQSWAGQSWAGLSWSGDSVAG